MKKMFHSSFVVDVQIGDEIILKDSQRQEFRVDKTDPAALASFKTWLHGTFMKGIPQSLTVFEYRIDGDGPDMEQTVVRILTGQDSSETDKQQGDKNNE